MVGGRTGTNERSFAVPHQKFIRRAEVGVAVLQSRWRTGRGMVPPVNAYRAGANMAATSVVVDDDTDHEDATTTNSAHVPLNFFFLFYFLFFSFFFLIFFLFSSVNVWRTYINARARGQIERNETIFFYIPFVLLVIVT